jgi:hypothetical protein
MQVCSIRRFSCGSEPEEGITSRADAVTPTLIQDMFFRIGRAGAGKSTTSLIVNSSQVVMDGLLVEQYQKTEVIDHGLPGSGYAGRTAA